MEYDQPRGGTAARLARHVALVVLLAATAACGGKAIVDEPLGSGGGGTTGTGVSTNTTNTTTPTGTPTASGTGQPTACQQTCNDLFACTQQADLCPGFDPADASPFIAECLVTCADNPALQAVVDANDCVSTVGTMLSLSPSFAEACLGE